MMEIKLNALYKDRIVADIQDFYRELESYSAIIDSRIGRLKTLTERHEANLKAWENIQIEMKKSKTGKEFLSYINENRQDFKPDKDFTKSLKDEIIGELKSYLAVKLNLNHESVKNTAQIKPVIKPQPSTGIAQDQGNAVKNLSAIKDRNYDAENDNEYNVAELIIDDIDAKIARKESQTAKTAAKTAPATAKTTSFDSDKITSVKPLLRQSGALAVESSNTFLNVLSSVGRALAPLFMKPETVASTSTKESAFSAGFENPALKTKNFNDLLQKEMKTSDAISQTRKDSFGGPAFVTPVEYSSLENSVPTPQVAAQKFVKSMEPNELVKLIEDLKTSRSRPDALKNLLNQGFKLEQIAELSSVPYSDLELTRNLYHI
jgi:hypothetical protein